MAIYTSYYSSPIGILKIQCTDQYINAITFENNTVHEADNHLLLRSCIKELDEYFQGIRKQFHTPVKQSGTDFQQKVWTLLSNIPFGKTISYLALSKQYGDVKAIRAVASANGKNNLAIVVPCHRVIGSNQSLTGYAGGIWRKKWLLEHEAKFQLGVQELFSKEI